MSSKTGIFDHFLTKVNEYGTTFINKHAPFLGLGHFPMSPRNLGTLFEAFGDPHFQDPQSYKQPEKSSCLAL